MRLSFILLLLLSLAGSLYGQPQQFVWAQSGLSLRSAGRTDAPKITTIPYGATVELTGKRSEITPIVVLEGRQFGTLWPADDLLRSEAYVMQDRFLEVRYGQHTGFVYGAYLFRVPPPQADQQDFWLPEWLRNFAGTEVTDKNYPGRKGTETITYPGGLVFARSRTDGNEAFSLSIPHVTRAQAYVIVDRFWFVESAIRDRDERAEQEEDAYYTILKLDPQENLRFANGAGDIHIDRVGDFTVISFVSRW